MAEDLARPELTRLLSRGTARHLVDLGYVVLTEMPLPNGLRADIVALSRSGQFLIIEIKSCLEDYRADRKWPGYAAFCDQFAFSVPLDFPVDILPETAGLIVADGYGGAMLRQANATKLSAPRRKAMTLAFATMAATRLQSRIGSEPAPASEPGWQPLGDVNDSPRS